MGARPGHIGCLLLWWNERKLPQDSEKLQSDWQLGRGQFGLARFGFTRHETADDLSIAQGAGVSRVMRKI